MNIALSAKEFNINNIYFLDPIKNIIINNSKFIRIIYSNNLLTLSGIYIICNIDIKNNFNNHGLILYINNLERDILNKYSKQKIKNYKIKEYFNNNFINLNINKSNSNNEINISKYILKISGIWESNDNIGITFKFFKAVSFSSIS
jgi:hypothetical protein